MRLILIQSCRNIRTSNFPQRLGMPMGLTHTISLNRSATAPNTLKLPNRHLHCPNERRHGRSVTQTNGWSLIQLVAKVKCVLCNCTPQV